MGRGSYGKVLGKNFGQIGPVTPETDNDEVSAGEGCSQPRSELVHSLGNRLILELFVAPDRGAPATNGTAVELQKGAVGRVLRKIVGVYYGAEVGFAEVGGGDFNEHIEIRCECTR